MARQGKVEAFEYIADADLVANGGLVQGPKTKINIENLATAAVPDASTTVKGKVELATNAETVTGTDTVRATTPAGVAAAIAAHGGIGSVDITVGAVDSGLVDIQLLDTNGNDLAVRGAVFAYLSDDADGSSFAAGAPSGGIAVGAGELFSDWLGASQIYFMASAADGQINMTLTEAGAATWYLAVVLPNGLLVVSDAITFTV